jgi:hypothetical protein
MLNDIQSINERLKSYKSETSLLSSHVADIIDISKRNIYASCIKEIDYANDHSVVRHRI